MNTVTFKGKTFQVDPLGFLLDYREWNEDFAEAMAPEVEIYDGLTKKHWEVIYFIRSALEEFGKCPLVYQTCRMNKLHLKDLKKLFPTGYLRGACRLAGLTYKEGYLKHYTWIPIAEEAEKIVPAEKTYKIDIRGFLVDPAEWDEQYAVFKANEMKMPENLTEKHWQIIRFLRNSYDKNGVVPTVYETCEANNLELNEFERLFPDGYHRGAVKIAGLRVR